MSNWNLVILAGFTLIIAVSIVFKLKYSTLYLISFGILALLAIPISIAIVKQTIYIKQITILVFTSLCSGVVVLVLEQLTGNKAK